MTYNLKHTYCTHKHNYKQIYTFLLTQVESQYFLLSIPFTVTIQISTPTHSHSDTHKHTSLSVLTQILATQWCMGGQWTKHFLTVGCRGLLGQHQTAHPYQQIGNTCSTASVWNSWWVCIYTCVFVCAHASRTNSERKILKCVCVWAGVYQRIIRKEFLLPVCSFVLLHGENIP